MNGVPVRRTATWREVGALILLPFGGVVVPVVGWFAGVVLLWVSDAWTARDKVIGTLVVPGGLLVPVSLAVFAGGGSGGICRSGPPGQPAVCTGGHGSPVWPAVLVGLLVLLPLAADAYLLWRLRSSRGGAAAVTAA